MYDLTDTIVAVSSAGGGLRSIVRITGPQTPAACERVFEPQTADVKSAISNLKSQARHRVLLSGCLRVDEELRIDARLYLFVAPHSYTGETLAELHIHAGRPVVEALMQHLLAEGLRTAGPGEFTARAYLNGKIDLAQAEAVNEVVSSSNRLQLDAAERLLRGRLAQAISKARAELLDCMSLLEAGLDFSEEDIEFLSVAQAGERLAAVRKLLEELLAGSIRYESLIDLPAVAIAGAPNAGKSSLLNALLGRPRSIVSDRRKTTRDVLSGLLRLGIASSGFAGPVGATPRGCPAPVIQRSADLERIGSARGPAPTEIGNRQSQIECVLFDCAGLLAAPDNVLDELAQRAALEALEHCQAVLFCVDVAKPNWDEDLAVGTLLSSSGVFDSADARPGGSANAAGVDDGVAARGETGDAKRAVIHIATKADLLAPAALADTVAALEDAFGAPFLATSARTGQGLQALRERIRNAAVDDASLAGPSAAAARETVALTARHKQAVSEAIENTARAAEEVRSGNQEVAALMLRSAYQALSDVGQEHLDERMLDRIFSRFCIGK